MEKHGENAKPRGSIYLQLSSTCWYSPTSKVFQVTQSNMAKWQSDCDNYGDTSYFSLWICQLRQGTEAASTVFSWMDLFEVAAASQTHHRSPQVAFHWPKQDQRYSTLISSNSITTPMPYHLGGTEFPYALRSVSWKASFSMSLANKDWQKTSQFLGAKVMYFMQFHDFSNNQTNQTKQKNTSHPGIHIHKTNSGAEVRSIKFPILQLYNCRL